MSWGASTLGQLGDGAKTLKTSPVKTNVVTGAVGIGSGRDHALAFNAAGVAWGWGDNTGGQLGDGGTTSKLSPVVLTGLGHVSGVGGGHDFSVVLVTG
jgi:alpha-tubulin suppressor-like RCC1 family protein